MKTKRKSSTKKISRSLIARDMIIHCKSGSIRDRRERRLKEKESRKLNQFSDY